MKAEPAPGEATAWKREAGADEALRRVWQPWQASAERLMARFAGLYQVQAWPYRQPLRLQAGSPRRQRRPYEVNVVHTDWGPAAQPPLVCVGGVANTAMRFAFLAADLQRDGQRVVCMDWLGRGMSGWLAEQREYRLETYVEQLRQLILRLDCGPVPVLGSSMGGTVAMELAARHPRLVAALVLNDVGPHIPRARRLRRAHILARHYVFRTPEDIARRVGAAQKNDGPVNDEVRLFVACAQTRWSEPDRGRVYAHDPRALLAYREDARHAVQQWPAWAKLRCPVLLLHGMESDALLDSTVERMQRSKPITLVHVPRTGHTPALCDRAQTALVRDWLRDPLRGELAGPLEFSLPLAPARAAQRLHS